MPHPSDQHVVPDFLDEPAHDANSSCWCEPEIAYRDPETAATVWLHRRTQ